jgi:hypothetical protein
MAITQGAGPHAAWLTVDGATFPIEHGDVSQHAKKKTSSFSAAIPMSYPGARETLANLGDNEAVVTVMTRGQTSTLFTGEVDTTDFDYIGRIIRVTGRDKSAQLHDNQTSEKWLNKKPSEIVEDLIGRVGLAGNIFPSQIKAGKKLEQDFVHLSDAVTFAQVIHKMAEFDGCRWFVDANGQFHYVSVGSPTGIYSITINQDEQPISSDCMMLRIRRNVQAGKGVKAIVKAWHPRKKQIFQYESNVEGKGSTKTYSYDIPTLDIDQARRHARSKATEIARHEITVHAQVVGDPSVSAGMGLQVSGTDFDQVYDIDAVHHEFGMSGHRTSITARSAKEGRQAS